MKHLQRLLALPVWKALTSCGYAVDETRKLIAAANSAIFRRPCTMP